MAAELRVWWVALSSVVIFNLLVWWYAARALRRERRQTDERQLHLLLSGVYAAVCAFRGLLPRADVQRMCLLDSFWSSVLVGRSVATVAELCFALQWALAVRFLADASRVPSARLISRVLVPLIAWAELASWYAVASTNFLGNVIEQSSWTLAGGLIALSYALTYPRAAPAARRFMGWTSPIILVFVWFMCTVDIPHYFARWQHDQAAGKVYLAWREGLADSARRWIVVHTWEPWRPEVAWMSLYFSVGVWTSIAFAWAPLFGDEKRAARRR